MKPSRAFMKRLLLTAAAICALFWLFEVQMSLEPLIALLTLLSAFLTDSSV